MSPSRAQIAVEFTIMAALAVVVGTVFLSIATASLKESAERERTEAMNDIAYTIQDELILATQAEDGYERTFTVPGRAGRFTYSLTSLEDAVLLESGTVRITYPLPNTTGTITKGENTVRKNGGVTIS